MIGKILIFFVAAVLVLGIVGLAVGLPISFAVVAVLALTLLFSGEWVPIIYNLRSLAVRKVSTLLTGLGLALVVFVFATVLMLGNGIRATLVATGSHDNVKALRKGATNEIQSGITPDQVRLLGAAPEVAIGADNQPQLTAEALVLIFALKEGATGEQDGTNVTVRGVGPRALEVHGGIKVEGRMAQPGTSEIVVGKALIGRFKGLRPGGQIYFARRNWSVVGVLDGHGSAFDSEIWGDVDQFVDAFQRRGAFSSATLRLKDPALLATLKGRLEADPQLNSIELKREDEYYAAQSEGIANFIQFLGLFVAIIFALGAALGAMITMYSQVAARTREIGTLRALGFRRRAVLVSFLVESMILGLLAGAVGVAAASLMQFASFSTMNFQTFSEMSFRFALTPKILGVSFLFAALMGYAGGLLPAVRAARMPIVDATRGG
jgi:putative ABC transport system permease protein